MTKVISLVIIVLATCTLYLALQTLLRPTYVPISIQPSVYPGQPSPGNGMCRWEYYGTFCSTPLGEYYTAERGIVSHIVLVISNRYDAGTLVLTWGKPSGYKLNGSYGYIYWPGRYAYVATPLRPSSPVMFVAWDDDLPDQNVWSGFRTH